MEEEWEGGALDDVTPEVAAEKFVTCWLKADNKAANSCCRISSRCRSSSRLFLLGNFPRVSVHLGVLPPCVSVHLGAPCAEGERLYRVMCVLLPCLKLLSLCLAGPGELSFPVSYRVAFISALD